MGCPYRPGPSGKFIARFVARRPSSCAPTYNIETVARYGPPDDFNNQPTQYGGYGGQPPQGPPPGGPPQGPPPGGPPPYGRPPQGPPPGPQHQPTVEGQPPLGGTPLQNQPTVEHGHPGQPLQYQPTVEGAAPEQYDQLGAEDPDQEGRPWYRKPVTLIGWAILVLILLALIAYGVTQLLGSDNNKSPAPSTTSTTTTSTTTETTTSTTTTEPTTTTSEPATTPTAAPPANPPRNQPPGNQPTQQPTHRPHLPQLPSTITVPGGPTITLPNLPR